MYQKKFLNHIYKNKLIQKHDKVLLAVSGGMDSTFMLDMFKNGPFSFAVAHCNFGLRGSESDQDEAFVQEEAKKAGVSFFSKKCDTKRLANKESISIQMAARNLRYDWFKEVCEDHGFSLVATAHHINDNTETLLLNLIRGTGIKGLRGIPLKNGNIIRPVLCFNREEIDLYIKQNQIQFRTDKSNSDTYYQRNQIRHQLIPQVKSINPNFDRAAQKLSGFAEMNTQMLHLFMDEKILPFIEETNTAKKIPISCLQKYSFAPLIINELLEKEGFAFTEVMDLYHNINAQAGKRFHSATHVCFLDREYLWVQESAMVEESDSLSIAINVDTLPCKIQTPRGILHFEWQTNSKKLDLNQGKNIAFLDADGLKQILVRNIKEGDTFYPLGMLGKKKIFEFLTDQKIPRHEKQKQYLICCNTDVLWLVGFRTDHRFRVKKSTQKIMKVSFHTN